jgi:Protein of unknown function (DUF1194)
MVPVLRAITAGICRVLRVTASRLAFAPLLAVSAAGQQQAPTNIELVLALDCSASVDSTEFGLQVQGIAAAFKDPAIQRAVEKLKPFGVAVAIVQWGAAGQSRDVVPFTLLESGRDAKAFGFRASLVTRRLWASETSIAGAIGDSARLLAGNEFEGQRKVIDVSGDGRDNGGADLETARAAAKAAGITVNGLAIMANDDTLPGYYARNVIVGADAFVEPARDYEDFARAIRDKLLRELTPLGS